MILRHVRPRGAGEAGPLPACCVPKAPRARGIPEKWRPAHFELTADEGRSVPRCRELRKHLLWYNARRREAWRSGDWRPTCTRRPTCAAPWTLLPEDGSIRRKCRDEPIQGPLTADD